ncbi:Lrp/AsnC family transcriptional regulator, partial [Chloroflexota bacterium]
MTKTDSTDEQLARLLGQDARQNSETLAKQLNLSSATVRRRLRKLIHDGLLNIVGVVDPTKFGFPLAVMIALDVSHDKLESTIEALAKHPQIAWVSTTTGRFDIIALAQFRSTDSLSEFMVKELAELEGLRDSETFVCLDIQKGRH